MSLSDELSVVNLTRQNFAIGGDVSDASDFMSHCGSIVANCGSTVDQFSKEAQKEPALALKNSELVCIWCIISFSGNSIKSYTAYRL
jgi:hypothetical protein